MALIVSVSGIRGIVGDELTPEVVLRYAAAFGSSLGGGKVAVGRDSRPSGLAFQHAVIAGLAGVGCTVEVLGILPTPTVGLLVREHGCSGGLQITASHNPSHYNGLKLFGPDGAVLSVGAGAKIQSLYQSGQHPWANWSVCGKTVDGTSAWSRHAERVLELVDAPTIRQARFKIVLDANGGAGGPLGTQLLQSLGCEVVPVACEPDGNFRHEPEPLPVHLGSIESIVRQHSGSIGAVLDPDADRLVLIDESGHCLSEELTLALAVQQRLTQVQGPVVINLSTSRTTEDVANAAGVMCHRSAVGEANVVTKMREVGALIGGEGNGGVIDPRVGWVRDPFIGIGMILERMAQTGRTLKQLVDALPRYAMRKEKYTIGRKHLPEVIARLKANWHDAAINEIDGIRFEWADSWLHLRASNTEPVVRVIAEAQDQGRLDQLCRESASILATDQPR
jgi:phosphomannomutase